MKLRAIKDIRLYESDEPNETGCALPRQLGRLLPARSSFSYSAQRIARKLHELQFSIGEADHLYLNFTSCLDAGLIQVSTRHPEKWILYVDVGMDVVAFRSKSLKEQEQDMLDYVFNALDLLVTDKSQQEALWLAKEAWRKEGKYMKIQVKTKETQGYEVQVFYQIAVGDEAAVLVIDFKNKKTKRAVSLTYPLRFYDDAYALVDKIRVDKDLLLITAKKSFRADLYTEYYKTPLSFNLKECNDVG